MGQYKGRKENAVESMKMEAEAKVVSGYPTIIIKKSILQDIKEKLHTDIIKMKIHNHIETTYYWSLQNIDRAAVITFRGLKPGKYTLEIEPYNLYTFIKDYNRMIKPEYNFKLAVWNEKLHTIIGDRILSTSIWKFEKEHGGAIHIIAEYPSITRIEGKLKLKYQIKNEKAYVYVQEYRTGRKRDIPHEVKELKCTRSGVIIKYKHGNKTKTTIIITANFLPDFKKDIDIKSTDIAFEPVKKLLIKNFYLKGYQFRFLNPDIQDEFDLRMVVSYYYMSHPSERLPETGRSIRDKLGKYIAIAFLKKLGYDDFYKDLENILQFKVMFPNIKPDLLAGKNGKYTVIEVKFRFNQKGVSAAFNHAFKEVLKHYRVLKAHSPFKLKSGVDIVNYGIVITGYNHKQKRGYLYFFLGNLR